MKGRPIKPTALLEHEKGMLYGDQAARAELEPKPKKELIPRCPRRFTKIERKIWKNLAEVLENYGLFTAANALLLEMLATAWAQYLEACRFMADKTKGDLFMPIYAGAGKNRVIVGLRENPALSVQRRLRAEIVGLATNLGLSSIALAKIGSLMLKNEKEKDEMGKLLD